MFYRMAISQYRFMAATHWIPYWVTGILFIFSYNISLKSTLIIYTHLRLLQVSSVTHFPSIKYAPCPAHFNLLDMITLVIIGVKHKLLSLQKSKYYSGIKIFNNLPSSLKSLMNENAKFKEPLKRYLNIHSFYSVDEFLLSKTDSSS
jgi:hypothetical protein